MTTANARIDLVYYINALSVRAIAAANPQKEPLDLGCASASRLLPSTSIIVIYYYYSAEYMILFTIPRLAEDDEDLQRTACVPSVANVQTKWYVSDTDVE